MRLSKTLLAWLMLPALCLAADEPPVIPLWPSGAPGSEGKTDQEMVVELWYELRCALEGRSCRVYVAPLDVRLPSVRRQ